MGETMSDWTISMREKGLKDLAKSFHTEKKEDAKRLENSGLPGFEGIRIPYCKFKRNNRKLMNFLEEYKSFTIRALPEDSNLPRRYEKRVRNFKGCAKFLKKNVKKGQDYKVYITKQEPQERSAIIISNDQEVRVEVGICDLDKLSHGGNYTLSCRIDLTKTGHLENKIECSKEGDKKDKETMKRALRFLELTRDSFNPLFIKGYFELILTRSGKIKFVDYKINQMYLK